MLLRVCCAESIKNQGPLKESYMVRINPRTFAVLLLGMVIGMIAAWPAQEGQSTVSAAPPPIDKKRENPANPWALPTQGARANAGLAQRAAATGRKPNIL